METIHKALANELAKLPRLLLLSLVEEKLSAQGLNDKAGLADALTDHCLGGGGETFEWDDGSPTSDASPRLTLSFSAEDVAKLNELAAELVERLPEIIENTSRDAAETLRNTLKLNWPEQAAYDSAVLDGFKARLEARWGKGFDLLRMLLTACRELGEDTAKRLGRSRANKKRTVRSLLVRLHARACQITAEIITLMENGFADGAMARWRTLYEIGIVATVIKEAGETLAKCYLEHEAVESKFAMDEYARCHAALGYKPVSNRDRQRVERAFAAAVKAHGSDFGKPYGWAAGYLKKKRVTFRDLEDAAQRSAMRPYYKMASYNIHADTPKSIFCRLGTIGDRSTIVAGATNAGFTEPAQNTAIALVQITALLLEDRASKLDVMIGLLALTKIRDEIPDVFLRAERRLKRDHSRSTTYEGKR